MIFNIIKNLLLLIATSFSSYVMLVKFSYNKNILFIILLSSFLYLIFHVADVKKRSQKNSQSKNKKYLYFTLGYITKRIILIGAFIIISFVFFISGNKIFLFGYLALTLLLAEIISMYLAFKGKTLFIELNPLHFFISENKLTIHANHISNIEFRHGIFYITLKNNKSYLIDTKRFYKNEHDLFSADFKSWIKNNQISSGEELKKLIDII